MEQGPALQELINWVLTQRGPCANTEPGRKEVILEEAMAVIRMMTLVLTFCIRETAKWITQGHQQVGAEAVYKHS